MNLRTRVAIGGAVTVVAAIALVGTIEYPAIGAGLRANLDANLIATAATSPGTYAKLAAAKSVKKDPYDLQAVNSKIQLGKSFLELLTIPPIGQAKNIAPFDQHDVAVAMDAAPPYFADVNSGDVTYRVYTAGIPGRPGALVRAAAPESDPTGTLNRLKWLLILLTPAAGLLAAISGRLLAARVLSPVARLTAAAEHITVTGDLTTPIAVAGRDEVARLGQAFNAMTGALDGSVGAQRRLVADASHELRTPLTSLVTNLELLAERPEDPQAPALIGEALQQALALAELTNDLVDLARFGEAPARSEVVRVDLLCAELAGRRGAVVEVDVPGRGGAGGSGGFGACGREPGGNALSSGRGPRFRCGWRQGFTSVIEVTDDGPGIPAADLPYVFDRFHRSPDARALPGSGLGLAIAKQVVEAHGGLIEAVPRPVGALLRIILPVAASAALPAAAAR